MRIPVFIGKKGTFYLTGFFLICKIFWLEIIHTYTTKQSILFFIN